ncbi:hypothetical protein SVIOM342S_10455 [Streptomyces violaceorubidus]
MAQTAISLRADSSPGVDKPSTHELLGKQAAAEIVNPRSDSEAGAEQGEGAEPLDSFDPAFALHRGGKMAVQATVPVRDKDDLSLAYTPGVAKLLQRDRRAARPRPRLHLEVVGRRGRDGRHGGAGTR